MLRVKLEREKRGWTRTRLGFEAQIHPSEIGKLEAGKIFPYPKWKNKLSEVFGISGEELFNEVT